MSLFASISDPTDLAEVRRVIAAAPGSESLVALGLDRLVISPTASLAAATELALQFERRGLEARGASVLLLTDATTIRRGDDDLKSLVHAQLTDAGFTVVRCVLGEPGHSLHADDRALDSATEAAREVDAVVSVGSGTISDIAKVASSRIGDRPLVLVQTAASVDGYTDDVSVILRSGAKRTIPSRWPDAVLADTTTITTAPIELNTSGLGEVLSLFTAPADWALAHRSGLDHSFHETPRDLLLTFAGEPEIWAEGVSDGDVAAIEQLTRVLAIRGIGTGIAGTTACLSGVEHLVSHMLDMHAAARGLQTGLHGAQVGVASLVAAAAWEHLANRIAVESPTRGTVDRAEQRTRVTAAFAAVDPSGSLAEECWRDVSRKLDAADANAERIDAVIADLPRALGAGEYGEGSVDALATALRAAGAVTTPNGLRDWVTDEIWAWAVANCHRMRNRFTVVDLLDTLGWWEPADVDAVLTRARTAAEGTAA
jgi:glycerol-1-phosphate dehydrogenase [NAD(P)+]